VPGALIGVDAGGTKTALRLLAPDRPEPLALAGPGVNLQRDGADRCVGALAAILEAALEKVGAGRVEAVCLGVSGAGREQEQTSLRDALAARLGSPGLPMLVVHDAEIALEAAFGAGSGAIGIVGTGSVAYGRTADGRVIRAGGWGARLGDEGSGTAIGRDALRAVARHLDGGPCTGLTALFAEHLGLRTDDDLIRWTYRETGAFASLVPLVLQAAPTDPIADALLRLHADLFLQDVRLLASRPSAEITPRLAFFGGVSGEPVYRAHLNAAFRRHLPRWQQVETTAEPVEGAVRRARRWAEENA
jgi:N-acetylglucosamine kinase-like BadF-type ATPase